jgi:hypothetical protein
VSHLPSQSMSPQPAAPDRHTATASNAIVAVRGITRSCQRQVNSEDEPW